MNVEQAYWTRSNGWRPDTALKTPDPEVQWVLVFGSTENIGNVDRMAEIRTTYPNAILSGCSTAGEIHDVAVLDDSLTLTAIRFRDTEIKSVYQKINNAADSFHCGAQLAETMPHEGLRHVFVLSDGLNVNGSELVAGLTAHLPAEVTITGGLSGDDGRFETTQIIHDDRAGSNGVSLVGLYSKTLKIGYGSLGGWDSFGPERLITRADGNVLYEMDGKSALELYKQYLGEHAKGLPGTGLLFPLSLRAGDREDGVVRTILAVDEENQSMIFAGEMPEGSYARLMKSNFNRLVDGAMGAADTSVQAIKGSEPELAICISCVGRKMVLKQRVEEEIEAVRETLGPNAAITGFYSYGEISPFTPNAKCELHNQTMTITTLSEA
ncbi:MAG: hypothetical protein GXP17_10595 [Gammaproteobacteria bacterium]|nr:hypothetical protein [Gammaproteobacteria bacterium]